ncbi:MAG: Spx/MgsR family RNA polymerase-binding regulatory protein [Xanthomonadales bacterium]|nr:Spx/MgsR family RNA polymerase-binding regulatory protein [Gammaproteobacteria bacterium]MBT8051602.1 Spx/MgsR family RNA polymerase-binding regulatory protein [Gammaproteobacteria bacterium]MBT8057215.1 Spx/MgsR family RNA polymerase-binding regulatory protein [Gammaproteobacteria bacterium]NNJ79116.1 Spx/MgsR family RNA polymerase-binding regulatory protein [Xanthomonadales bacterium]NNL04603.1 Spx/MgsR family RNA polymerase-binding regulatory protein [Xanthomonadales bacterium]
MLSDERIHLHVYGIPNCDTVRAALAWLDTRRVPHTFHDFRKEGVPEPELRRWLATAHGPLLLNRRSTTWRQLSAQQKEAAEADPVPLMLEFPTLIKRPVITDAETILDVGFDPANLEDYI